MKSIAATIVIPLVVLGGGVVVACGGKKEEAPQTTAGAAAASGSGSAAASGSGAASSGPDVCAVGRAAIDNATCTTAEMRESLAKAKKSLDGIVEMVGAASAGDPKRFQIMCAQLVLALERDAKTCTLAIDAAQRAAMTKLLDEFYAQRTEVVPTGDAAADAVIAKIAAVRDAACACRDGACLDKLDKQLGEVGAMPASAPDAARTLGSKLLEDAARCAQRARSMDPPK